MERLKNNCVSGPFFYSISRHCPKIESLAPPRGVARRSADSARRFSRFSSVQHAVDTASTSPSTVPNAG